MGERPETRGQRRYLLMEEPLLRCYWCCLTELGTDLSFERLVKVLGLSNCWTVDVFELGDSRFKTGTYILLQVLLWDGSRNCLPPTSTSHNGITVILFGFCGRSYLSTPTPLRLLQVISFDFCIPTFSSPSISAANTFPPPNTNTDTIWRKTVTWILIGALSSRMHAF